MVIRRKHGQVSVEQILKLKPDLVLAWRGGNRLELLEQLNKFNIPIQYVDSKELNNIPDEMRRVGKVVGRQIKANALAHQFEKKLHQLEKQYQDQPGQPHLNFIQEKSSQSLE